MKQERENQKAHLMRKGWTMGSTKLGGGGSIEYWNHPTLGRIDGMPMFQAEAYKTQRGYDRRLERA